MVPPLSQIDALPAFQLKPEQNVQTILSIVIVKDVSSRFRVEREQAMYGNGA